MPTEAGRGEHRVYQITTNTDPAAVALTPGLHYLGIDAVAWYVNKKTSFFSDRLASGTLEITLAGKEHYHAALGTFELADETKTAPVFEHPVLPDRNFVGGPITLKASLIAVKKDNVVGGLLRSAATASLGIVKGMVDTASLAGPSKFLSDAGGALIGGVKQVLSENGPKREALFDFEGLEFNLQPSAFLGSEMFILLHRGAELEESRLTTKKSGRLTLPYVDGAVVVDGAWLLLRLRRSDEFSGSRDWYQTARDLRARIATLVDDFGSEVMTRDDALKQLKPSAAANATIFDEFSKLRAVIYNDGVLSERQAAAFVADLKARVDAARKSISENNAPSFPEKLSELVAGLKGGVLPKGPVSAAFISEVTKLSNARPGHSPDAGDIIATMQHMPKTLKVFGKGLV